MIALLKWGRVMSKVNSNGGLHKTKINLRVAPKGDDYLVCWETESVWKSVADCQCTFAHRLV
jgi:hypothetical protein